MHTRRLAAPTPELATRARLQTSYICGVRYEEQPETLEVSVSISETPAMPTRGGSPGNRGQSAQQ